MIRNSMHIDKRSKSDAILSVKEDNVDTKSYSQDVFFCIGLAVSDVTKSYAYKTVSGFGRARIKVYWNCTLSFSTI